MSLIYNIFCYIFSPVSVLTIMEWYYLTFTNIFCDFTRYCVSGKKMSLFTLLTICRADTVYRLCYSSILIHWRSYMMHTRDSLFQSLFSFDMVTIWAACGHKAELCPAQECVVMVHTLSMLIAGSRIYEAASVLVRWGNTSLGSIPRKAVCQYFCAKPMFDSSRYWFVKSSLQTEVMETFKRDQFVFKVLLLPQVIVR